MTMTGAVESVGAQRRGLHEAAVPMDAHRLEHRGVLVEGQEDERAKPVDEQAARREAAMEPSLQVRARVVAPHAGEAHVAAGEKEGFPLEYPKANRQADARERGKIGQSAIDLDEHVFVDRLIEAVTTRAERGDDCTEDLRRRRRKMS
jgi:hypothetical protein